MLTPHSFRSPLLHDPPATCRRFPYTTLFRSPLGRPLRSPSGRRPVRPRPRLRALRAADADGPTGRRPLGSSEEHTAAPQSRRDLVCRLLLEKKKRRTSGSCTLPLALIVDFRI